MLNRKEVVNKMEERGFVVYSILNDTFIQFVSKHMYEGNENAKISKRDKKPVINVIVDLDKDTFECQYNIEGSQTILKVPKCGGLFDDEHFDRIVGKFESEAKWMSILTEGR